MKARNLFITTVAIMAAAFLIGVFVGRMTMSSGVDEILQFVKDSELNTESYLIEQELIEEFEESNCGAASIRFDELSRELWKMGKRLSDEGAEQRLGEQNYVFLKKKYHLMQTRAYILFKKLSEICDTKDRHIILFYFSGDEGDSARQGGVLDRAVENHNVTVIAMEYNYSEELSFLEDYYRISDTPSMIVDYEKKFSGFTDYDEIESVIR